MRVAFPQTVFCRILFAGMLAACAACQYQPISAVELEIHQSQLNKAGLTPPHVVSMLRITCAPPEEWEPLVPQSNLIYSHRQWRSLDHQVGMGVAYMHTPVPFSAQMLVWFAKARYRESDTSHGRLLGEWTDSLGRYWFEAEDNRFHVTGYAMTRGLDAWIVYSGFRLTGKAQRTEIALAAKGADSVAPLPRDQ
jgi:hypothetical protein